MKVKILLEGYMRDIAENKYDVKTTITLIRGKNNIIVDTGNLGQENEIKDALAKEKLSPTDINYVVLSHGCPDHVQNNHIFTNAKFIDSTSMYEFGKNEFYVWQGNSFEIERGVTLERSPGHTTGDMVVFVKTEDGIVAVAGDLFFFENDWEYSSRFAWNKDKLKESRKIILERADFIIPGHGKMFKVK